MAERVDAKKRPIGREAAIAVLGQAKTVYVVKGKKFLTFNMAEARMEDVLQVALGPTGNLRAPAILKGETLVIGFDEGAYREAIGA